jgi:predicted NAD/FAD-binding protein
MSGEYRQVQSSAVRSIAVVGSGISGLACAWLLHRAHRVTVFEADARVGGHSNTVQARIDGADIAVDTGFIVYNEPCYPNLTRLFAELKVATAPTDMSFAVSLEGGAYEYAGKDLPGLFAQPGNILKPRFWSMIRDLLRFYREAPRDRDAMGEQTLDDYLAAHGYGAAFRDDHLYPMAAAIWSTPAIDVGGQPAANFVRFCENHGLLRILGRPQWRTVAGGSKVYVAKLTEPFAKRIETARPIVSILRDAEGVELIDASGGRQRFDAVVIAAHADQALKMLAAPSEAERRLLGAFRYGRNEAVLHRDVTLMPRRRAAWAAWNYLSDGSGPERRLSVTYWMNQLQPLGAAPPLFVTLNPLRAPAPETVVQSQTYEHPQFTRETMRAQKDLWDLQGQNKTWFCGAYFGAGFHEDGLQAGLAAAEDLGGVPRPWTAPDADGRICRKPLAPVRERAPA